ncbi:MAG: hypothetical protein ACKVPY_06840 [Paracoccaceae bacterium]
MPMQDQKGAFAERLKRINAGHQYEHQDVVGFRTQKLYEVKYSARDKRRGGRGPANLLMILIAFLSGIVAVVAGRLIFFHLSQMDGMPESFAQLGGKGMLLSALVVAGILTALLHLSTKGRMPALLVGCMAMHFGEAAVAANAPQLWAEMFSSEYVAAVAGHVPLAGETAG